MNPQNEKVLRNLLDYRTSVRFFCVCSADSAGTLAVDRHREQEAVRRDRADSEPQGAWPEHPGSKPGATTT